jgi:hypothetical protein
LVLGSNFGPDTRHTGPARPAASLTGCFALLRLLSIAEMRHPDRDVNEPVYYDNLSYKALVVLERALTLEAGAMLPRGALKKYQMLSQKLQVCSGS